MLKTLILFLAALCVSVPASAQFYRQYTIGTDVFDMYTRIYRDRVERFSSARGNALQMTLPIDDENSRLTLESWADNRADLRESGTVLTAGVNAVSGEEYNGSGIKNAELSGVRSGARVVFSRIELEGYSELQRSEPVPAGTRSESSLVGGGAGYAFGSEELSFGLRGNFNRQEQKDATSQITASNHSMGGAVALRTDVYELGATADYVMRGSIDDATSEDLPLNGPSFGAQAMIKPIKGLKAALRGNIAMLSGDATDAGVAYDKYETEYKELGARLEWKLEALPLTFGLEYAKVLMTPETALNGTRAKNELVSDVKTIGAGFRLLGDRLLLAAEAKEFGLKTKNLITSVTGIDATMRAMTAGAELWILPGFGARASYQKMVQEGTAGSPDIFSNTIAGGVGIKGERFTLDGTVRSFTNDEDAISPDSITVVHLAFGMKF